MMSQGIKPYDFVQQVYYAQEKTLLDFWPSDDKYKEVLVEANLILQELQNVEDWTWLRDKVILGPLWKFPPNVIPEFTLPEWVYKPSTINHDAVRFHAPGFPFGDINPHRYISVPFASAGDNQYRKEILDTQWGGIHMPDMKLRAIIMGDVITFNRPLTPIERAHIATIDVQRRIKLLHVCDHTCKGKDPTHPISYEFNESGEWSNPCSKIEDKVFTEIPDPNYMIQATAARHAEGSPPALARVAGLQDAAQRILSAMRQNDASATDADYQDWEIPGYIEVI